MRTFVEAKLFTTLLHQYRSQEEIWMLTLYAKNVKENIPAHILKKIKEEADGKR